MKRFTLGPQVDLGVFYEADAPRYAAQRPEVLQIITKQVFADYYRDCPSLGFLCDGQAIGGVIFDGKRAHIAVLPDFHGRWAWLLKPALDWLFDLKREVLVDIEIENERCITFMERNGWQAIARNDKEIRYRMVPDADRSPIIAATDNRAGKRGASTLRPRRGHRV